MITGATKNKVDDIWQKMWEGGITNPLEVISQLTYLMFMHQLDEKEFEAESLEEALGAPQPRIFPKTYRNAADVEIPGDELRWSRFKDKPAETMYHTVSEFAFPYIKTLGDGSAFTRSMESATFGIPTPKTLLRAVDGIDALFGSFVDDISDLGDLYEYMLSKLNTAGMSVEDMITAALKYFAK
jgi:type I restriction enzyme M protein